jgi:PAS domain S-box-containing protein
MLDMLFNFPPFSIVFIIGSLIGLIFSVVILLRPPAPGKVPFTLFLIAITFWTICRTLEAGAVDYGIKVFWGKLMFLGTVNSGVMWLSFALDYTGSTWWKRPRNLALLYLLPVATLVVIWTNQWTGWFWSDIYFSPFSSFILMWEHNFWFWIFGVYEYLVLAIGILILWKSSLKKKKVLRRQIWTITLGMIFPIAGNIIYAFGQSPVKGLDLTPFGFLIAGTIYFVTIFRFRFMDLVPVARSALVENLPDGILVTNSENQVADVNPAAARLLDLSKSAVIGKKLNEVCPNLDLKFADNGRGAVQTEIAFEKPDAIRYLNISVAPIRDNNNDVTGRLIVLRDITQRRIIEQTLRESESRYSTLVEQSNEGVIILQNGVYKYVNDTFLEISGYSPAEIQGQKLPFAIADDDSRLIIERNRQRSEGLAVPEVYELKVKHRDGRLVDTEISVGNIIYENQPAQMITVRDVTERKISQRKIETLYNEEYKLRQSLQEEMDKRSKYVRSLVHELRTPLTAILASSELLEMEIQDKILQALVKNIRRASLNLELRINELIELARGEIGLLKINPMPLDMSELIREMVSEMTPVASARGLVMTASIPDLPLSMGDRSRLRQVMTNLLSNAIKFTSKGSIQVTAGKYNSESIIVSVKDTGRGIPPDELEQVFDPYRRKSNEGQGLSGLGIGLALSKIFVDLHKGRIWVESSPAGSTFSFTLPVYHEPNG